MSERRQKIAVIALLFFLPLVLFWGQTVGGQTLLPVENLYQFEPYATYREVVNAPEIPHNALLSDLILQNYQWKHFIREQFAQGEIPLWNAHQFAGVPFMAAGQQSTLYPLSLLYYIMPLPAAYGWFTVVNLWLAGVFMLWFVQGLGVSRFGGTLSGITYQLCGMFVASAVHPMIIGAVVWLPILLLMTENLLQQKAFRGQPASVPWVLIGAGALAFNILAGHPEIMIHTLLITAYYAGARLVVLLWSGRKNRAGVLMKDITTRGAWIALMVVLGLGIGAVQLIPLYEFVSTNWRAERSDLQTVLGYAHPTRDLLQFIMPNFYGSPAQHHYFDVFSGTMQAVDWVNSDGARVLHTDWGIKNYVEAALYVGILPLILSAFGVWARLRDPRHRVTVVAFAVLAIISLTFAFGLPTYALIYGLPGINQLNTAFRWIFGVTVAVAVLAGIGADALADRPQAARRAGWMALIGGVIVLIGLGISRLFYPQIIPLIETAVARLAKASSTFNTAEMFYSVQFVNVLIFGIVLTITGAVIVAIARGLRRARTAAIVVLAVDLLIASWGFNPSSDPLLLDFTPPAIQWLQDQDDRQNWRYAVINGGGRDILTPNMTLRYGLDDIRGYDSIITAQYVDYMREITPQNLLDHNQIAPLYIWDDYQAVIESPRFNKLNVRYIITHKGVTLHRLAPVYEDEAVRIWENLNLLPRAYILTDANGLEADAPITDYLPAPIIEQSGREMRLYAQLETEGWLVVSQSYAPGWKAFIRPMGTDESMERELPIQQVQENFQGVALPAGDWVVRLIYSPPSFQLGAFGTAMSLAIALFLAGTWAWRRAVSPSDDDISASSRLARNSVAPILLNLFNRGIDFVFAFIMFRILGPEEAGFYYYAIVIFGWFDIFTNFGLDVYLMREAGRLRDKAGHLFYNTSALRFLLVVAAIPALIGFLMLRQASLEPLNTDVLLAIALFYFGLVPGSLSKGLTSLYYAFERAEYPAMVTTITTISRVLMGVAALLMGYGIVGLAAVSIITNVITLAVLSNGARRLMLGWQSAKPDAPLIGRMVGSSWALMLNHFLATIFFQIDIVILEWIRSARVVGLYRVAYSWLLAINVIPAFFTQALLPVMSRQAQGDREALRRTYTLGIKLLTLIAYPLAVIFTFLAEPLTWILGGSAYLPDGAIALQIMIWSIPIGWMNSLTQYALIALDLQRRITVAFVLAVAFNIITNLIFIPIYGYQAAAVTTILSELVLLIPFALLMQHGLGKLNWLEMFWRPALASGVMAGVMFTGWGVSPLIAFVAGCVVYPAVLVALKPFTRQEWAALLPVLPARVKKLIGAGA